MSAPTATAIDEVTSRLKISVPPAWKSAPMGDYGWSPKRYEKWLARMILESVIR
jgi:hypothetical protein